MAIEDCYTPEDGLQPLYTIIEVYYIIIGAVPSKVLPPSFESFWGEGLVVWIGHQQKTIPALRSEEQVPALGVPPGGWKVPTTYPPYPLFILAPLFASVVTTVKVCRGCCSLLGNLSPVGRKLLYYVPCRFSSGVARHSSLRYSVEQVWSRVCLTVWRTALVRVLYGLRIYLPFWYVGCQMRL